jgi:hypothetical protein
LYLSNCTHTFFLQGSAAPVGLGHLTVEVLRSHSDTPHSESSGQVISHCRDLYLTTHNTHKRMTSISLAEFKPAISPCERPDLCLRLCGHWDQCVHPLLQSSCIPCGPTRSFYFSTDHGTISFLACQRYKLSGFHSSCFEMMVYWFLHCVAVKSPDVSE